MKSWCLQNFRVQIALDCILACLNFQNFPGEHAPGPPSFSQSCLRHLLLERSRQCYTHIPSYAPPGKNSRCRHCFFGSCFICRERALAIPNWETDNFVTLDFFESIISQLLYFCGAYTRGVCVGISGAMANSDNEQVFF